jgi:hypothetical protein
MKKRWWVLLALLLVGLALVSTVSARAPENKSDIDAFAVRVADLIGLDHGVVGEAFTQAKQDIHAIALTKRLERARTTLDNLVATGDMTRADADAKLATMSDLPLKKQSARRGKGKPLPIALEAKLDAMVTAGEISRADADAKLSAMSDLPLKKQSPLRGKGKSGSVVSIE